MFEGIDGSHRNVGSILFRRQCLHLLLTDVPADEIVSLYRFRLRKGKPGIVDVLRRLVRNRFRLALTEFPLIRDLIDVCFPHGCKRHIRQRRFVGEIVDSFFSFESEAQKFIALFLRHFGAGQSFPRVEIAGFLDSVHVVSDGIFVLETRGSEHRFTESGIFRNEI